MKKIYAFIATVIVLAAVSVAVIINAGNSDSFFEANVEALADVENSIPKECYNDFKSDPNDSERFCGTCEELPGIYSDKSYCPLKK